MLREGQATELAVLVAFLVIIAEIAIQNESNLCPDFLAKANNLVFVIAGQIIFLGHAVAPDCCFESIWMRCLCFLVHSVQKRFRH